MLLIFFVPEIVSFQTLSKIGHCEVFNLYKAKMANMSLHIFQHYREIKSYCTVLASAQNDGMDIPLFSN